jgi:LPS-assembly lipoprotein
MLATIRVLPIKDRIGQQLEFSLREALNPRGLSIEPRYTLTVGLTIVHIDLGILSTANATRARVDVYADVTLRDIKTGTAAYSVRTQSTSSFNIVADGYSDQVAEEDARTRTVRDLSDDIRTRLTIFLQRKQAG